MSKIALLVGINKYKTLGDLAYAKQDAEAFAGMLTERCGFTDGEIRIMTCGAEGLSEALARYVEIALDDLRGKPDLDLLVFGFWGHGFGGEGGRRYLCGIDTVPGELERTALSLDVVRAKLIQAGALDTLVILDCCQNRAAGRGAGTEVLGPGAEDQFGSIARDVSEKVRSGGKRGVPTVAILNSCREGQCAYEWNQRKHGIFTEHLLDRMAAGETGVARLFKSVVGAVESTALELYRQHQTPFSIIEGAGDIELGNSAGTIQSTSVTSSSGFLVCPECGFYNTIDQTFKCRVCGREYLCRKHFDAKRKMCEHCAAKQEEIGKATGMNTVKMQSGTDKKLKTAVYERQENLYKVYVIGETGPAGGIVFCDKGSYSDGWRYLESAPVSTEWKDKGCRGEAPAWF